MCSTIKHIFVFSKLMTYARVSTYYYQGNNAPVSRLMCTNIKPSKEIEYASKEVEERNNGTREDVDEKISNIGKDMSQSSHVMEKSSEPSSDDKSNNIEIHRPRPRRIISSDPFENSDKRDKEAFMDIVDYYSKKLKKTGHIEFVYMAMGRMEQYGVNEDLNVYKAIMRVMPMGPMVPTNMIQAEFFHFIRHQECITELLQQMEENNVIPDREIQQILLDIFGPRSTPIRRYYRMMYWLPKFKHLAPWPLPRPLPREPIELAKLAVRRMCSVDLESEITVFYTKDVEDSIEDTWIVSGQSPTQSRLLNEHAENLPLFIDGPFRIYLRKQSITYFVLRGDPIERIKLPARDLDDISNLRIPFFDAPNIYTLSPPRSVHEQQSGTIFSIAATGTSSRDSLLSWVRSLEVNGNPKLAKIPIIFKLKSPLGPVESESDTKLRDSETVNPVKKR